MTNTNNKNIISPSVYDIYNKYLAIAEKYFGVDKNYLTYGPIGYWTELMASNMRDSAIQKTMIYNENFLNTAIMPKSVYNWAKMFNVDISMAKPSKAYIKLSLLEDDFSNYAEKYNADIEEKLRINYGITSDYLDTSIKEKDGTNNIYDIIVISKDNVINAGSYPFSLEHSIILYRTVQGSYRAKYCLSTGKLENESTNFGDYSDPYIPTTLVYSEDSDSRYIELDVTAYQYKAKKYSKRIASSSFLDTRIHRFNFNNQMAGLSLIQKQGDYKENVELLFSDMPVSESQHNLVAYYSMDDENTVQIKFKGTKISPIPQAGTTLEATVYETYGSAGNIFYADDIIFNTKNEDYKNLSIIANLQIKSEGGLDKASINEIKNIIIKELSTRGTIISLADLNSYFESLAAQIKDINNSSITFVKKRDDIIKRTFTAYLLLRDGIVTLDSNGSPIYASAGYPSKLVPTNTVDIIVKSGGSNNQNITINSSNKIIFDPKTSTYVLTDSKSLSNEASEEFYLPFEAHLYLNGYKQVKYYYTSTNNSLSLITNDIVSENNYYMTPLDINVYKYNDLTNNSIIKSSPYIITTKFKTNINEKNLQSSEFKLGFKNGNNIQYYPAKYISMNMDNNTDVVTIKFEIEYKEIEYDANHEKSKAKIHIVSPSESADELDKKYIDINENEIIYLDISNDVIHYGASFRSHDEMNFFYSLGALMESDIEVNEITVENNTIYNVILKDVPVISATFFKTWGSDISSGNNKIDVSVLQESLTSQLFSYIKIIKESLHKLENNTFIDLKFRNTYGESRMFSSQNTNIRLQLDIYLKNPGTASDDLKNEIRDFIRVQVDMANNISDSVNNKERSELNVSDIIALTTASYSNYIRRIDFIGLNGTFNQHISKIRSEEEDPNMVLEYFNLDSQHLNEDIRFL